MAGTRFGTNVRAAGISSKFAGILSNHFFLILIACPANATIDTGLLTLQQSKCMNLLIRILIMAGVILLLDWILPGIHVDGTWQAILTAIVLSLINAIVKPILVILTLPVTVITLGLFLLVLNALMVMLAAKFVGGFSVDGFWAALLFSILLSFTYSFLETRVIRNKD